jgi:proline iminopeptidase/L-proline amide hydrolase
MLARRSLLAGIGALVSAPAWARLAAVPAPTRELMVPTSGGRIYVRVNGDLAGPRPPIVLAHGGPGGTHNGLIEALALADERAVILYDQLGSGRSDPSDNTSDWIVPRFVDELHSIRQALGIERWHVCGHSWGATIALEYAARRPAALASVVLAGPLISTRSWIADADALRAELPAQTRDTLAACDSAARPPEPACETATAEFYAAYNRREKPSDAARAYREAVQAAGGRGFNARLYERMWGKSEFVATGSLKDYDGEPLLLKLDGPRTLFLVGQYDEARPLTMLQFARRVPGSEVAVVPGAAHGMFGDRPDETIGTLRGWLSRQDAV